MREQGKTLKQIGEATGKPCTWVEDADGNWHTGCNEIHIIIDGTPSENGYVYCPYCGLKIETVIYNQNVNRQPQAVRARNERC